jgi:hypothetical protein
MRISSIICEGLSSVLYHSTGIYTVLNILSSDRFRLTPDLGSSVEAGLRSSNKKKIYYMSFARSKMGEYHSSINALLVIDGSKLSNLYSGGPVDYWGNSFDKDEMEDRLYSTKPYISDATQYIRAVHVYYNASSDDYTNAKKVRVLRKCWILCKRNNIPMYVYTDPAAYRLLDVRKSVPVSSLVYDRSIVLDKPYSGSMRNYYSGYSELLSVNDISKLSPDAAKLLDKIKYDNYYGDVKRSLSADIHNDKSNDRNRANLDKFLAKVLSLNLHSVSDILKHIREKFKLD